MNQDQFPLISILMPCYNHSSYIEFALNSVIEDTYPFKEIIITNDGSTDNSDYVIKRWIEINKESGIAVNYTYQKNKGLCKSLNQMIEIAKGKYIVILASDDMLYGNTLMERMRLMKSHPHKKVLICDAKVINDEGEVIMDSSMEEYNNGDKSMYYTDDDILVQTLINPAISGATMFIDKSIYDEIGLYKEDIAAEDWYFYQRAAAKKRMFFKDIICSYYRVHQSNTSGINANRSVKIAKTIVATYMSNLSIMPNLKFKILAFKELVKWYMRLSYYKLLR